LLTQAFFRIFRYKKTVMKIVLQKGQQLFFTSDTHYCHSSICSATTKWVGAENLTRDFKSLDHMNTALVDNINNMVGEDDILIHLGDWSFGGFEMIEEFRSRILCKNIHLVLGNHDQHIERNKEGIQRLFSSVQHYMNLDVRRPINKATTEKFIFVCMHYPIASWHDMNQGVIHLHGHVHLPSDLRIAEGKAMDVGVDGNGLEPLSMDEILELMKNQPIKKLALPKDHHEARL
jgi:calcineurin-like phosphoesterase family protein